LKVEIKVQETWINKIDVNQPAKITTTAFPDEVFAGKVLRKAPMADSKSYSLMADVKVYTTDVSIEGTYDYLRTGMTAKVEILIDELENVLYVPIQSVVTEEDDDEKKACYVSTDKGPKRREVEIGLFNDDFVEIKNGLEEGEQVLLNPPRWTETEKDEEEQQKDETEQTEQEKSAKETESTEDIKKTDGTKTSADVEKKDETPKTDKDKEETIKKPEETKQTEKAVKIKESAVIHHSKTNMRAYVNQDKLKC
jgi:hypothetical protein